MSLSQPEIDDMIARINDQRPAEIRAVINLLGLIVAISEGRSVVTRYRISNSLRDAADMIERVIEN